MSDRPLSEQILELENLAYDNKAVTPIGLARLIHWRKQATALEAERDALLNELKDGDRDALLDERDRLRNDLLDALDLKCGDGPTALSMVVQERDRLRAARDEALRLGRLALDEGKREVDRLRAQLWAFACSCGNVELDPQHHAPKCPFRAALNEEGGEDE